MKIFEVGLFFYFYVFLDKLDIFVQCLKQIIRGVFEKFLEIGRNIELMQVFRIVVMFFVCRLFDDIVFNTCYWADGFLLNFRFYQMFLEVCFDVDDDILIIEEVDEFLEFVKKIWVIFGMNEVFYNICFFWVLFYRYVETG